MGRNESVVTPVEAAKILGVSRATVYRYQRDGLLRSAPESTVLRPLYAKNDVEALASLREEPMSIIDMQKTILAERTARRAMERRLDRIERMLCIQSPVVGYDESEVLDVVERVHDSLKEPPTEVLEIQDLCTLLFSLHEEFLHLVEVYTGNPEPWSPFLRLAQRVYEDGMRGVHDQELVDAYAELSSARRAFRQTAFFYITNSRGREYACKVIEEAETDLIGRINQHVNR